MKFKIASIFTTVALFSLPFDGLENSTQAAETRLVYQFDEDGKSGPPGPKRRDCLLGDVNL